MKRTLLTPLALAAVVLPLAGPAHALIDLDSYTINFSAAGGALGAMLPNLTTVDEVQFLAHSYLGFTDQDSSSSISIGDTFSDYTAVRFTGFTDLASNDITPLLYGSGAGRTHEMTAIIQFDGTQTGANSYKVDAINQFEVWFDAGAGFTGSNFSAIGTFADGVLAETQTLIEGGGVNFDPVLPNGTISLITEITDQLHNTVPGEEFELDDNGDPLSNSLLFPFVKLVMGIIDANNLMDDAVFANAIAAFFGFDEGIQNDALAPPGATPGAFYVNGADFDFGFTTRSDGSFNKALVGIPEPGTVVLMGLGLIGLAGATYRRRSN